MPLKRENGWEEKSQQWIFHGITFDASIGRKKSIMLIMIIAKTHKFSLQQHNFFGGKIPVFFCYGNLWKILCHNFFWCAVKCGLNIEFAYFFFKMFREKTGKNPSEKLFLIFLFAYFLEYFCVQAYFSAFIICFMIHLGDKPLKRVGKWGEGERGFMFIKKQLSHNINRGKENHLIKHKT